MFWAQVVSRIQEFHVLTGRFCALILEELWKINVAEISYRTYHGWKCIKIYDCVNGWAIFSAISATLSVSEEDKSCH